MDIHKKLINIDQYMKDLKKHALGEFKDLFEKEQQELVNADNKPKKKKKKIKNKKPALPVPSGAQAQPTPKPDYASKTAQSQNAEGPLPGRSKTSS